MLKKKKKVKMKRDENVFFQLKSIKIIKDETTFRFIM